MKCLMFFKKKIAYTPGNRGACAQAKHMEIEIRIEGPVPAISELRKRIADLTPAFRQGPPDPEEGERKAALLLMETERSLDERLATVSRALTALEADLGREGLLELRVRNLAYSEPPAGSERFMEPFTPIPSITVQPWHAALARPADPRTILVDPSHAFGTGTHPSTRLCLRFMERCARGISRSRGPGVLDFGCGTGLLAIAAVKMGAYRAVGVEIDPDSARTARKNARLNGLVDRVSIRQGSWETVHETYDLVLANLVASVHLRVGKEIPRRLKENGRVVVSGFSEKQMQEMETFYAAVGLRTIETATLSGWAALLMNHPA